MKRKLITISCGVIIFAVFGIIFSANHTEIPESANSLPSLEVSKSKNKQNVSLIGTWIKEKTSKEGGNYPDDSKWQLTVTFDDNGRFVWGSKRNDENGKIIDDSLTGTYSIEKGFLISYKFDKPTNQSLEKIPEFFAFRPNQLLGQHTFEYRDNYLRLGHDGGKIWIYLKNKVGAEQDN